MEDNKFKIGDLVRDKVTGNIHFIKRIDIGISSKKTIYIISDYLPIKYEAELEPVTHLTTKEFIKLVEDMGYEVEGEYRIGVKKDEFSRTLATVSVYDIFELNTISSEFKELQNKELLFKILTLYENTPLELRKEKEKLYTLQCPLTKEYLIEWDDNEYKWSSKMSREFTQEEIDELKQGSHGDLIKTLKQELVK